MFKRENNNKKSLSPKCSFLFILMTTVTNNRQVKTDMLKDCKLYFEWKEKKMPPDVKSSFLKYMVAIEDSLENDTPLILERQDFEISMMMDISLRICNKK